MREINKAARIAILQRREKSSRRKHVAAVTCGRNPIRSNAGKFSRATRRRPSDQNFTRARPLTRFPRNSFDPLLLANTREFKTPPRNNVPLPFFHFFHARGGLPPPLNPRLTVHEYITRICRGPCSREFPKEFPNLPTLVQGYFLLVAEKKHQRRDVERSRNRGV